MRTSILLLFSASVVFASCSSAYKSGQTPDDVYFSPQRPHDEYLVTKQTDDRYDGDAQSYDDQYLRMKVHNRLMWSTLDDPYFYNPAYSYGIGYGYNNFSYWNWSSPWTPYTYWNYSYNPYCPVVIPGKTNYVYSHPRMFNLNTYTPSRPANGYNTHGMYNNNGYNNNNRNGYQNRPIGSTNQSSNVNTNTGNFLRNVFNSGNNNSSNNNTNNSSYSPSRSSSSGSSGSSGSSSSGGSAPVRKF
jgi:uncharacterized membrane protein YgcG